MKKQFLSAPIGQYRAPMPMILSDHHPHHLAITVMGQFASFLLTLTALPPLLSPSQGSE
jgi:hypothetical protein